MSKNKILEKDKTLSESLVWKYQRDYFQRQGQDAWHGSVPYYATNNLYISNAYAQVVFQFIKEGLEKGFYKKEKPIYLIELGSGIGKLAYHFLTEFMTLLINFKMVDLNFCYVLTDFTQSNLDFWKSHVQLKHFFEKGVLDYALYDACHPENIHLKKSNRVLSESTIENPLIAIGNYFFDTLPCDVVQMGSDGLKNGLVSIRTPQKNLENGCVKLLKDLIIEYRFEEIPSTYYTDPFIQLTLSYMLEKMSGTTMLIPIVALKFINHFLRLSKNRLLLLISDKGYRHEETLDYLEKPKLSFHGNAFSLMVNFPFISRFINFKGGSTLSPSSSQGLKTFVYLSGKNFNELPSTKLAYKHFISDLGVQDFLKLKNVIIQNNTTISHFDFLAVMRLSRWDPKIMLSMSNPELMQKIAEGSYTYKKELFEGLKSMAQNHYTFAGLEGYFFELGILFYSLNENSKALESFLKSLAVEGDRFETQTNISLCYFNMHQYQLAKKHSETAIRMNSDSNSAKSLNAQISDRLNEE